MHFSLVAPFLLTSISCVCWLGYGILRGDSTIIFVNGVGLAVQSVYMLYYYYKTRLKNRLNKLILIELISVLLTVWFLQSEYPHDEKLNILGMICMVILI